MKGETSTGFKFELDEARLDDMEFVTALSKAGKGDVFALPDMLEKLLQEGKAPWKKWERTVPKRQ